MIVKDTKNNRHLAHVAASMAIENMFVDNQFMNELLKVAEGKKTSEELRQEVIRQYAR